MLCDDEEADWYHPKGPIRPAPESSHVKASAITIPYADWNQVALDELTVSKAKQINTNAAKNVILVIGDGMGPSTVTGARMLKAQKESLNPHQSKLSFEEFPYTGLSKVSLSYNLFNK